MSATEYQARYARMLEQFAQDIRAVDGNHSLGAAELAEKLAERGWQRHTPPTQGELDSRPPDYWRGFTDRVHGMP